MKLKSTRSRAEERIVLGNEALRLDFDPRTSDTMYNYIWLRHPASGRWERPHNFGADVRVPHTGGAKRVLPGGLINAIGMCLEMHRDERQMNVRYPRPLIQYRQFDDKVGEPELVHKYPDFAHEDLTSLVHADAEVEFVYEIDADRPSYTVAGQVHSGAVSDITYIVSALWTDNHVLPTMQYVEGLYEFDIRDPQASACRQFEIENVAYILFYRHDGEGVPFALLPLEPTRGGVCNFYDNAKCLSDFGASACNQAYVPDDPAVTGCNDTGYLTSPQPDGRLPGVRVAFFPELGYGRAGQGQELRDRLIEAINRDYLETARAWDRHGRHLAPRLILQGLPSA